MTGSIGCPTRSHMGLRESDPRSYNDFKNRKEAERMSVSCVTSLPDLTKLDIPKKLRFIPIGDDKIFCNLKNKHRSVEEKEGDAGKGDYVLVTLTRENGSVRKRHVELGRNRFPDLEKILIGSRKGQKRKVKISGEDTLVEICKVSRVTELLLTDESIKSLELPGISSLADYRRQYLRAHGAEIAGRLFHSMQPRLLGQVVDMMECDLAQEELDHYHQQKRLMIQNISGDVDQRLSDAYGSKGDKSKEECDRLFYEDNKQTYAVYIWGKALAEQKGVVPDEEAAKQAIDSFCMIYEKTEEQVEAEGLREDAIIMFQHVEYKPVGVCSQEISFDLVDGYHHHVHFTGGCPGNTKGVAALAEGQNARDVARLLKGVPCREGNS